MLFYYLKQFGVVLSALNIIFNSSAALSADGKRSLRSPRFSPDGEKLAYLECESDGPHCRCLQLKMVGDTI